MLVALALTLNGCATDEPWPDRPPNALRSSSVRLAAETVHRPGPWVKVYAALDRSGEDNGNRIERRVTARSPTGAWDVETFEIARGSSALLSLQIVTLSAMPDGGVALVSIDDRTQSTRTTFSTPLVLMPAALSADSPFSAESEAVVTAISDPSEVLDRGPVTIRTTFTPSDADGGFEIRQTMLINLSSSRVQRMTYQVGDRVRGITSEDEELAVTVGPFTVASKSRRLRMIGERTTIEGDAR